MGMIDVGGPPSILARIKHFSGLDRAIGFSVLGRVWSTCAGVVTVTLIARFLNLREQGYYYTFSSLVAMQIIFELGFSFVVLQLAAHERAHLVIHKSGLIEGQEVSRSRLASILQKSVRWYSIAAVLMAIGLTASGFYFFTVQHRQDGVAWQFPWLFVVLATSCTFQIDPVISFLEGCGKVVEVGRLRTMQAILGSLLAWAAMVGHHGLLSPALMISGQAIAGFAFLFQNRKLLLPLLRLRTGVHSIRWAIEIWPFQWRIAVSWASSYFILQLMNPILFAYRGPVEAGRMGMSMSIATSIGAVAIAWMTTKASPFGTLIARSEFAQLDKIFFRTLWQSTAILSGAIGAVLVAIPLVIQHWPRLGDRILPLPLFALLLLTMLCTHVVVSLAYYLRAHKKEPFLFFWVAIAVISVLLMTVLAKQWGAAGVTISYFICGGLLRLAAATLIFFKKRKEWHTPATQESPVDGEARHVAE